ncbi:MAG: ABC transporter substrate-binding protein, partial [Clostridiales bacterium]
EKLVGISPASMGAAENGILGELFPEILQAKTSFMQGKDLNIEELLLLKPDVVFYNAADTAMGQALTNAGFGAVAVSTSKWDYDILETYRQWIALLSQVFPDYDISAEVDSYSQQIYDLVQERTAVLTETEKKKILFLFKYDDTQMVTSGKHFFGQFWCDAVNGVNVAESLTVDNDNAVITMEQVYAWNPDVIFITNFTPAMPEDLYQNKIGANQWQSVPAVQQKQVYKMPLGSYRTYTPGVDTPITLLWVAKSVYPELFADIDIAQKVAEYYSSLYGVELTADQIDRMLNPGVEAAAGI